MNDGFDIVATKARADSGPLIRILVIEHRGSTPREAGTSMIVNADGQFGTIGGGALEFEAVNEARRILRSHAPNTARSLALGPSLGQCCGGAVTLVFERFDASRIAMLEPVDGYIARPMNGDNLPVPLGVKKALREMRSGVIAQTPKLVDNWIIERTHTPGTPLWIYGAGHVGRALVTALQGLPFEPVWIDSGRTRFPDEIPAHVDMFVAENPADAVKHAPATAHHLVLTYSHALDFDICRTVLQRDFAFLGVIGSDTKRARFVKRLAASGVDPARLTCPIGDRALGKEPMAIAVGVVADLLKRRSHTDAGRATPAYRQAIHQK